MRKKRSDSKAAAVQAFVGASTSITPPKPLNKNEMIYWENITRARAREDWTEIDLMHAWNLAKQLRYIEETHESIARDGMTLVNERGTIVDNPAFSRLEKLTRLVLSLSSKLHVHAEATVGKSEDSAKRATNQRNASRTMGALDDLIARPSQ